MLFFGVGSVRESERSVLVNAFVAETAVAIGTLFYSVFRLRKSQQEETAAHTSTGSKIDPTDLKGRLERAEAESRRKDELVEALQAQLEVERQEPVRNFVCEA